MLRPRSATAMALTDVELLLLDREDLLMLFQRQPDAAQHARGDEQHASRCGPIAADPRRRNVNVEMEEKLSVLQRISDWVAWFSGSLHFLLLHAAWFIVWVGWNMLLPEARQFDPFPFGLLTMIVSLEAIFLSCIVLISQNRQVAKDKIRNDIEYDINVKAELEVTHLHEKIDHIHEQMATKFAELERVMRSR